MNERQADAAAIRELLVQNIEKNDLEMVRHNLGNLKHSFSRKLEPGMPEYKTSSRSLPPPVYHPFAEQYGQVLSCFQQLEVLLNGGKKDALLAKANEAADILWPQG